MSQERYKQESPTSFDIGLSVYLIPGSDLRLSYPANGNILFRLRTRSCRIQCGFAPEAHTPCAGESMSQE
ncbi:hypothetical protein ADMFC3_20050 [Geovibrio sp. ADMFC3]